MLELFAFSLVKGLIVQQRRVISEYAMYAMYAVYNVYYNKGVVVQ